jgi:type I restriction enzyme S subunit
MILPLNWIKTSLESIAYGENAIVDGPFGSNLKTSDYINDKKNGVPVLTTKNLEGDYSPESVRYISKKKFEELRRSQVNGGDILVAKIGSIGKTGIYPENLPPAIIPANLLKFTVNKKVQFQYVYLYLNYHNFQKTLKAISSATAQPAFNVTKFRELLIPLPPLPEQHRIVAKIEALFSELDNGTALLKAIKTQLAVYRQAVLKWAFEGKLTEEWRKGNKDTQENTLLDFMKVKKEEIEKEKNINIDSEFPMYDLPNEWEWVSIGSISKGVEYGTSAKSKKTGKVVVLRMGNIQNGIFEYDDLVYTSDKEEIKKYKLNEGDVLFNRTNSPELVGKTALYTGSIPSIFAGYLIRLNQISYINEKYLTYYLNSPNAKQCGKIAKTDGVNQSNINGTKLSSYPFPICSKPEQQTIVSAIESRLSECDKLEKTIDDTLALSASLRQSILKKAFEGRLVPQDPNDEPAEKLLERIKAEKAAILAKQKQVKKSGKKQRKKAKETRKS